jgi:hypothetical protein
MPEGRGVPPEGVEIGMVRQSALEEDEFETLFLSIYPPPLLLFAKRERFCFHAKAEVSSCSLCTGARARDTARAMAQESVEVA